MRASARRIRSAVLCPLGYGRSGEAYPRKSSRTLSWLGADAEVGRDDDDVAAAEDARGGRHGDGGEADLAPARREDVLAVAGARHPQLQSTRGAEACGRPEQVLADRPVGVATLAVIALNALPERRAVAGRVAEEAERAHGPRVHVGGRGERERAAERRKPVRQADRVQLDEHLALE